MIFQYYTDIHSFQHHITTVHRLHKSSEQEKFKSHLDHFNVKYNNSIILEINTLVCYYASK